MRYINNVEKDAREIIDTAKIILNEFYAFKSSKSDLNAALIQECRFAWKAAEREMKTDFAKSLKDMHVILVKKQIIILGFPIFST